MDRLLFKRITFILLILVFGVSFSNAQTANKNGLGPAPKKSVFGLFHRKGTVQKPKSVEQIKKEQDKKDKKKQDDYVNAVKQKKDHAYQIQSPEVQARMKQNQKDIDEREKARQKKLAESSRKARKKLRK